MNLTTLSLRQPARCHVRAFTALEALVMLLALFILTMLGIGLWLKKDKEDKSAHSPTPQNTTDIIKPEIIDPSKVSTPEKPEIETEPKPAIKAVE